MSAGSISQFFEGWDLGGPSIIYQLPYGDRYVHKDSKALQQDQFYDRIASGEVYRSEYSDVHAILFTDNNFNNDDFYAGYQQVTCLNSVTGPERFFAANPYHIKSLLLVASAPNAQKEFRISYRDMFLQQWMDTVDQQFAGKARRTGPPGLNWDIFDDNYPYLDPTLPYLAVRQGLTILAPWPYTDYHAEFQYWIYLYPSGPGLRAWIPQVWMYLDGGTLHDCIWDEFEPAVMQGAAALQDKLNVQLAQYDNVIPNGVQDVYYLPGRQTTPVGQGSRTGTMAEDITIVIALK